MLLGELVSFVLIVDRLLDLTDVGMAQDPEKERDQPHMKRVSLEEVLEAEERLNSEGGASVRQQWDFDVPSN